MLRSYVTAPLVRRLARVGRDNAAIRRNFSRQSQTKTRSSSLNFYIFQVMRRAFATNAQEAAPTPNESAPAQQSETANGFKGYNFNEVVSNIYRDPFCTELVAESFAFSLLYDAHQYPEVIAEWFGSCMRMYPHRAGDWMAQMWYYLLTDSSRFARDETAPSDDKIDQMAKQVLYAARMAWWDEEVRNWVRSLVENEEVKKCLPHSWAEAQRMVALPVEKIEPVLGDLSAASALAYDLEQSDSISKDAVVEFLNTKSSAWLDAQWARFFATGDPSTVRKLIEVASLAPPEAEFSQAIQKMKEEGNFIQALRTATAASARWSLAVNTYQHPMLRELIEAIVSDEEGKKSESQTGVFSAMQVSSAQSRIAVMRDALQFATDMTTKHGEYKVSNLAKLEEDSNFRAYQLLSHFNSKFTSMAAEVQSNLLKERYMDISKQGLLPPELCDIESLTNSLKDKKTLGDMQNLLRKWSGAFEYPPKFASEAEKAQCISEINKAMCMIAIHAGAFRFDLNIAYIAAKIFEAGYNLDLPMAALQDGAPTSLLFFCRALDFDPFSAQLWMEYGINLAQTRIVNKAIPALHRAVDLGLVAANWTLALQYAFLDKKEEALAALKRFEVLDDSAKAASENLAKAIREGSLKWKLEDFGNSQSAESK